MNTFLQEFPTVVIEKGITQIILPNGDVLKGVTDVVINDKLNEVTKVTVTFFANLAPTELEAQQQYMMAKRNALAANPVKIPQPSHPRDTEIK